MRQRGTAGDRSEQPLDSGRDLAALAIRLTLGPTLMYHGYNKVAGAGGLAGTTRWFEAIGLRPARLHARMAASTELGAGLMFSLGAATPLPATAIVGLMAVAARTDHRGKGFFVFKGGAEYVVVCAGVAAAATALGPGRWSIDGLRNKERRGPAWTVFSLVTGVAAAAGLLALSYQPEEPKVEAAEGATGEETDEVTSPPSEQDGLAENAF